MLIRWRPILERDPGEALHFQELIRAVFRPDLPSALLPMSDGQEQEFLELLLQFEADEQACIPSHDPGESGTAIAAHPQELVSSARPLRWWG